MSNTLKLTSVGEGRHLALLPDGRLLLVEHLRWRGSHWNDDGWQALVLPAADVTLDDDGKPSRWTDLRSSRVGKERTMTRLRALLRDEPERLDAGWSAPTRPR